MAAASSWKPDRHAVSVVLRPDPGGIGPTTISVRHPTAPYMHGFGSVTDVRNISDSDIHDLITAYLGALSGRIAPADLGFGLGRQGAVATSKALKLDCLPSADSKAPWRTSFWFDRSTQVGGEHTLVVSAMSDTTCTGGIDRYGIHIVAHPCNDKKTLCVTSMSACLPENVEVLIVPAKGGVSKKRTGQPRTVTFNVQRVREPASQQPKSSNGRLHTLRQRRPTGKEAILRQYLGIPGYAFKKHSVTSEDDLVRHEPSRFVRPDIDAGRLSQTPGSTSRAPVQQPQAHIEGLRCDAKSVQKAYYNANLLFERLESYGIAPDGYFRSSQLPLAIEYRSGMPYGPGKDGQTVNAAVEPYEPDKSKQKTKVGSLPNKWRRHQIAPDVCQDPPELKMHFALANRSHRGRQRWDGQSRSPAEPLGIVADPRWVWHEFGHVLLMATTGELEMRIAHSPGDALAAIAEDPGSDFVDCVTVDEAERERKLRWRGATFPWVYLPRRHDRCVRQGWSWSGAMHRPLRELPDAKQPRRKGYRSEQILSTSLFRLYLCLGGMTPDTKGLVHRQAASDYTLYLIIKALGLLGDARIVPANDPDQFVSALIDADVGTEEFEIPESKTAWRGGFAHKAIRWAFEAQGLYATGRFTKSGVGRPPPVDIYIKDRRQPIETWCGGVKHGTGSYAPVSLAVDAGSSPWFSSAIDCDEGDLTVTVPVRNRGSKGAADVSVEVFYTKWEEGTPLPQWEPVSSGVWRVAESQGGKPLISNVETTGSTTFGPFELKLDSDSTGRYLILAQASCDADPANTDLRSNLPCSRGPMPLAALVANDNNLALALIDL